VLGEVLNVAVQIAGALTAAHVNGIVHRDIKPENIILRSDGIAKVLDFGIAKLTGQGSEELADSEAPTRAPVETDSGVVMGTAIYMSPEQARGHQVDARTDIFSFGVVIYELLTGHLPFEGSTIYEIIAATLSDRESPPLSRYLPEAPAELERIVSKALRKNRDERYQTIKDLLLDLQSLKQQLEFERTHRDRLTREDKVVQVNWLQTRGKQLLGVLCIVMLVGGTILYAWWKQRALSSQPEIKSLAVLPLKSLDAGENYLGLGIADAAIRRVSQTGKLIVRPTSAVRRYLNEDTDALAAAKQLGVDSVLEGSFQRADDCLRVSVNLLRSRDGVSLWTDSFDLRMSDIFTIQDTVAQQVASRLRLRLDASQQAQLTKRYTSSPIAYEFYLKGAYTFDQRISPGDSTPMGSASALTNRPLKPTQTSRWHTPNLLTPTLLWRCFTSRRSRRGYNVRRRRSIACRTSIRSLRKLTWHVFNFCTVSLKVIKEKLLFVRCGWRTNSIRTSVTMSWLTLITISALKTSPRVNSDARSKLIRRAMLSKIWPSLCMRFSVDMMNTPQIKVFGMTAGVQSGISRVKAGSMKHKRRWPNGPRSDPTSRSCHRQRLCSLPQKEIFAPPRPRFRSSLRSIPSKILSIITPPTTSPVCMRSKVKALRPSSG